MAEALLSDADVGSDAGARSSRPADRFGAIAAMLAFGVPGGMAMIITPAILSAFVSGGRVTSAQASMLSSSELVGMTIAILLGALIVARIDRRLMALCGVLIAVSGHLLSIYGQSYELLFAARFLAGFGNCILTTVSVASMAATSNPDRVFGFALTANLSWSTLFFLALPLIGAGNGPTPILITVIGIVVLAGCLIPWIPARSPAAATAPDVSQEKSKPHLRNFAPALIGLFAMFVLMFGIGAFWPMVALIGEAKGVTKDLVTSVLAGASFAGIAAGAAVSWLGDRAGRIFPLSAGLLGMMAAMTVMLLGFGWLVFAMAAVCFMFCWIFGIAYVYGALAAMDESGRLVSLSIAMQTFGFALGQALAAAITSRNAYDPAIYSGAVIIAASLALMILAIRLKQRVPAP